ncbi:hypothetical protein [Methanococcus aeolicus]|uniref:hypothetical protein n=1 Tax=Methanococcus aeolicus TaxID=42879 RepID=UPI0012F68BEE|nr:hypothetical protein [Methanococcus aeolicus]
MVIDNNSIWDILKVFFGMILGIGITIVKYKYLTAHDNQKTIAEMKGSFDERYKNCDKNFNELIKRIERLENKYEHIDKGFGKLEVSIQYFETFIKKIEK